MSERCLLVVVFLVCCVAVFAEQQQQQQQKRIAIVFFDSNGLAKRVAEGLAEGFRGTSVVDVLSLEPAQPPHTFFERVRAWWQKGTAADLRVLPSVAGYDHVWLGMTAAGPLGRDAPWQVLAWAAARRSELVRAGAVSGFVVQGRWTDPDAVLAAVAKAAGVELLNNFHVPTAIVPRFDPGMLLIRSEWRVPPAYKKGESAVREEL